jgi:hypothetical protein
VSASTGGGGNGCSEQPWCTFVSLRGTLVALLQTLRGQRDLQSRSQDEFDHESVVRISFFVLSTPAALLSLSLFLSDTYHSLRHPSLHRTRQDHLRPAHSTPWTVPAILRLGRASWVGVSLPGQHKARGALAQDLQPLRDTVAEPSLILFFFPFPLNFIFDFPTHH